MTVWRRTTICRVMSSPRYCGLSLPDRLRHDQEQVGVVGLFAGSGDQRMRLAAVVRLVVEEVGHQEALRSADLAAGGAAEPGQIPVEPSLIHLARPARDVAVGLVARGAQFLPTLDKMVALLDRRCRARPVVEAAHPLAVAPQDVAQRAVDRVP